MGKQRHLSPFLRSNPLCPASGCPLAFTCCEEGPYKTLEVLLSNENGRYQPTSGQFAYDSANPSRSQSFPLIIQVSFSIQCQALNLATQTILKQFNQQSLMILYRGLSFQCFCSSSWHLPFTVLTSIPPPPKALPRKGSPPPPAHQLAAGPARGGGCKPDRRVWKDRAGCLGRSSHGSFHQRRLTAD